MLQLEVSTDWLKQYELRSDEKVIINYIRQHPRIVFVVERLSELLSNEFSDSLLALELHTDPELDEQHLLLWIVSPLDGTEAFRRLQHLETVWWSTLLYPVRDELVLLTASIDDNEED